MLVAVKGNREEVIDEKDVTSFSNNGYDIYESKDGKVTLKIASVSKKVSYAEYQKLLEENKKLKVENKKLKEAQKETNK